MKRKIGIIGLGECGQKHLNDLRRSEYFDLVGICDKKIEDIGRVEFFSKECDLFDSGKPEAVIIATPAKFHKEIILEALKYVKYIFVEPPCTINLDQAREMRYAASSNSAKIVVGFDLRFNPTVLALKREFEKESRIYSINIIRGISNHEGCLQDALFKELDLVRFLTSSEIVSFDNKNIKFEENKEIISSSIKTKNDILINISLNNFYPNNRCVMEISANSGVYMADLVNFTMQKFTPNGRINLRVDSEDFSIKKQHELFAEICNGTNENDLANIDDIIKIRELLK